MTLEQLVEEFAKNVVAQNDAIFKGDPSTANEYADRSIAAFEALKEQGDSGRDALAVLLRHPDANVRCNAASCLLRHRTAEAQAVLEELAQGDGMVAFEARQSLANWKKGTWALDLG